MKVEDGIRALRLIGVRYPWQSAEHTLVKRSGVLDQPVMQPETRYARSNDVNIAYQIVGDGPFDLVLVPGWVSNMEIGWQDPRMAQVLHRLASFARLILFDKRGTGLSDRVAQLPTLEERMDDVRAVMDAAGSSRAALVGYSEGGPLCAVFAATYPDRTSALVIYGSFAKRVRSADYPWGPTVEERREWVAQIGREWGTAVRLDRLAPSRAGDERFRHWWATYLRQSASPGAAQAISHMNSDIDIRSILPHIHVPTLVIHRQGDRLCAVEGGRYLAQQIPGAQYVELPGDDHWPFAGDTDALIAAIQQFLTGAPPAPVIEPTRLLLTVLFVDIVNSTGRAAELGDRRWHETLSDFHQLVRREFAHYRGQERTSMGDGFLASFDGPGRAIRCANTIIEAVRPLGLQVRVGVHTGECDLLGDDLTGIAVHIGARIADIAGADEVLVSSTVKDLVAGSGLRFNDRGRRTLRGVPGVWRLWRVAQSSG